MRDVFRNISLIMTVVAVAGLTGCTMPTKTIDTSDKLAAAKDEGGTVVYGKFRLLRNGQEVRLDDGVFANSAKLHIHTDTGALEMIGKVGRGGEFAWALTPGDYQLNSIRVTNRSETTSPQTNLRFTVPAGGKAVYLGTMTLETTLDYGYYGLSGTFDSVTIDNDCASDCADRLAQLGLPAGDTVTSLIQQEGTLAGTR
ncbi:MAG: hypothetical protein QNJ00_15630 [Woeseiaceae bacterium]|nr:hypothetical protein [Woeseiaceae bacterium]